MPTQPQQPPHGDKATDEAEFLVEEFEVTEREASELVTGSEGDAADTQAAVLKKRGRPSSLADTPVPEEPASDLAADNDEERLKPVVRARNERTGAG